MFLNSSCRQLVIWHPIEYSFWHHNILFRASHVRHSKWNSRQLTEKLNLHTLGETVPAPRFQCYWVTDLTHRPELCYILCILLREEVSSLFISERFVNCVLTYRGIIIIDWLIIRKFNDIISAYRIKWNANVIMNDELIRIRLIRDRIVLFVVILRTFILINWVKLKVL
jgi:hypothetical protein